MNKNDRKILIINDVTGYGRVSSFNMMSVMTACGLHPYVLPTALVSNTMDYGSCVILDTTEFMKDTINKWREFGFRFSVITTGMINSAEQLDIIISLIEEMDSPFVLTDPIMADDGKLYPGMYEDAVKCYRKLAAYSSVIVPNFTEAVMLADIFTDRTSLSDEEYDILIDALKKLGAKSIVITGCRTFDGRTFNLSYEASSGKTERIYYDNIPVSLIGTGDLFSAELLSAILKDQPLSEAVHSAAQLVRKVVIENRDNPDHYDIRFEKSLSEIR